jgi:hypothetical protein
LVLYSGPRAQGARLAIIYSLRPRLPATKLT